jgi:hypothetical protein
MQDQSNDYIVDEKTGCWIWQKTRRGPYGRTWRDGRMVTAHRWYYEREHGPILDGLEIDHLCGNRLCVNPSHLEAVTHAMNMRRSPVAKLTTEQVAEIKADRHTSLRGLAKRYGITDVMVGRILSGHNWKDVPGEPRQAARRVLGKPPSSRGPERLTEQEVAAIRAAPRHYGSGRELAHRYGVSESAISEIRRTKGGGTNAQRSAVE